MVVTERNIRVSIQALPVNELSGALDFWLCRRDAGDKGPLGPCGEAGGNHSQSSVDASKSVRRFWGHHFVQAKQAAAKVPRATNKATLQGFVQDHADRQARVYMDEACAYETLPFEHESVKHSVSGYVRGQAHTKGVEAFWSMLKLGYDGTFHKPIPKQLDR